MARDYSEQERAQLAADHKALRDGSYPMPDCGSIADAITAYGRAPEHHRPALRALIRRRNAEEHCGHNLDKLEKVLWTPQTSNAGLPTTRRRVTRRHAIARSGGTLTTWPGPLTT